MELERLVREFGEALEDDVATSPRTASFYRSDLRDFADFLRRERGIERIGDVKVGEVMAYRNYLLEGDRKRFTVYRKDAAVRRFLDWVRTSSEADYDFDPIEPVHQPLDQNIVTLDEEEAEQLLSFPLNTTADLRDAVMVRLMLETGVTVGEIRGVLRSDVSLDAAQVNLGGPGSHLAPRTRKVSPETRDVIARYLEAREDETPELLVGRAARPFTTSKSLQNALHKRCDQTGLPPVSPMVLRHTFAVRLLRGGASLNDLKEAMGVRDTTNIGVYKKFV
ncbi:Site-specific recombinase XerD [Rubrobacter radiotolerans]|uniref:Site-specific recombinase XerD n=1 Tax=Rubrobacter radiotolerans TaxID=42256 RepID=A0A023X029_RUBRA|nr:tyrosine-type recombinase/integrase [Rubrobacter radiotolerans]AHY45375.1 Site-specific recombinase XerD [Rubrobacter radiotolerans]MDX5892786.1 tyrosine-type recombinase/integrase [Rubrobacter radiotolerans]SMC02494.1 Phage integrase, N-terminal SAM-like domain [Rubrobacter radiotolerans DSM 5868]